MTTSPKATPIAVTRTGHGPPLVLVHGTTADHTRWAPILPRLAERFTVHAVDRRGRGGSGDAPDHTLAQEIDDVASVVDGLGASTALLGHSFGALCALEAALRTRAVAKLVIYEPPIPTGAPIYPHGVVERLEAMLREGDRAGVVRTFFREVVHMPPAALEMLEALPNWPSRVAAAHTIPRELRASEGYRFEPSRFASFGTPTLVLLGSESPTFFASAATAVHEALANSRLALLEGQQHAAMDTAPDLFLSEVMRFLEDA